MFLDVEPHLQPNSEYKFNTTGSWLCQRGFTTHVVSADQGTDSLQRAEGVVLAVRLAVAGIPDQVVVLLVGQDVGCRALRRREAANIRAFSPGHQHSGSTSGMAQPMTSQAFFFRKRK